METVKPHEFIRNLRTDYDEISDIIYSSTYISGFESFNIRGILNYILTIDSELVDNALRFWLHQYINTIPNLNYADTMKYSFSVQSIVNFIDDLNDTHLPLLLSKKFIQARCVDIDRWIYNLHVTAFTRFTPL